MTTDDQAVADVDRRARLRGAGWLSAGVALAALTVGVYVAVDEANDATKDAREAVGVVEVLSATATANDLRISGLEQALKAQRAQFRACQGKRATAPGCKQPISPEPQDIEPVVVEGEQGAQGIQGLPGLRGPEGRRGPRGPRGFTGESGDTGDVGPKGDKGDTGGLGPKGDKGDTGSQGDTGATGRQGEQGPPGPAGSQGPQGERGAPGINGLDAPRVTEVYFGSDPAACVFVVVLSDGTSYAAAAPPVFCTPAEG